MEDRKLEYGNHKYSYEGRGYMCDGAACSCGWKSESFFDGAEYAEHFWREHAKAAHEKDQAEEKPMNIKEKIARAIEAKIGAAFLGAMGARVSEDIADAILSAIKEAGYVVVKREPTQKMMKAHGGRLWELAHLGGVRLYKNQAHADWIAMIAAQEEDDE